jgi:peptidoglycan biosynthesis protein MviN/MurJ (putative lipid II flippase)
MNMFALYVAAAATTAIAGVLHLMLGPNNLDSNVNQGILFIVGGIAQVFWIIPMIRRWGYTLVCNRNWRYHCVHGALDHNTNAG